MRTSPQVEAADERSDSVDASHLRAYWCGHGHAEDDLLRDLTEWVRLRQLERNTSGEAGTAQVVSLTMYRNDRPSHGSAS